MDPARLPGLRLDDPEGDTWQAHVRAFMAAEMAPAAVAAHVDPTELTGLDAAFERAHHRRSGARGYLGIAMPADVGGGGRPPSWKGRYDFEAAYHDAPSIDTGVTLCGHALAAFGSPTQRATDLAAMVAGERTACIAYTEEEAGSDLGALAATAVRSGDDGGWVLDGTKVLVTGGHRADVCLTIMRTAPSGPPKSSFTMFLVPMATPGVRVVRHPTINGWTLEDIHFDAVLVGEEHVVGDEGRGWGQMLGAIGAERAGLAYLGWATHRTEELMAMGNDFRVVDAVVAHGRARRFSERAIRLADAGAPFGHTGSVAKLVATELLAELARLGAELAGPDAAAPSTLFGAGNRFAYEQLERIHPTIGAGTSEIQRDTISRFLGALLGGDPELGELSAARTSDPPTADPLVTGAAEIGANARALLVLAWRRASERTQFGRPLIDNQVLRHRLVDALIDVEAIELAVAEAIAAQGDPVLAASAKLLANGAGLRVVAAAHQVCGGWGYLEHAGLGPHTRRIRTLAASSPGTSLELRHRLVELLA